MATYIDSGRVNVRTNGSSSLTCFRITLAASFKIPQSSEAVWVAGSLCGHDQILVPFHYNLEQRIELPTSSNTARARVDDNVLL
jgi:hypothetical protein